jgi:uncharacterized protein (TIGR03000 family)
MYSMVLMAALTTGTDMPDFGRRRGGCCGGCYGGMGMGCGGCYGGMGMGWGGCYGMGRGMGMGWGGYGYGGYALGGYSPMIGGYAYSPVISSVGWGTPVVSNGRVISNAGTMQSFYSTPTTSGNEATLIVHVPQSASLKIDGQATQQSSGTRVFTSPPLEQGKTYVYKISAEVNRDGHTIRDTKNVEVRAGQRSEVTMNFGDSNRGSEERSEPDDQAPRRNTTPRTPPR